MIDLDRGKGVQWEAMVETAVRLRGLMQVEGFRTRPKLTGGKGIHILAPLEVPLSHDEAHRRARQLVTQFAARNPEQYVLSSQADRRNHIFLNYLRNGRGITAVGPYSPQCAEPVSDRCTGHLLPHTSWHSGRMRLRWRTRLGFVLPIQKEVDLSSLVANEPSSNVASRLLTDADCLNDT